MRVRVRVRVWGNRAEATLQGCREEERGHLPVVSEERASVRHRQQGDPLLLEGLEQP